MGKNANYSHAAVKAIGGLKIPNRGCPLWSGGGEASLTIVFSGGFVEII